MSGVTDKPYRLIMKRFASDILFPEFVSIDAIHHCPTGKTARLLDYDANEHPIIAQLFGSKPDYFFAAAKHIKQLGFDGVDINFGCPAPKVARSGGGCSLLRDLGLCKEIIQAVLAAVGSEFPVSVKTRKSYKTTHVRDFCNVISELPLSAITIHGRPFEKPYEGQADLDCIKEAKSLVPFLVIASGNGHTPEAAKATLDYTGCDGIAVARGSFGKPWLIKQIKDYLQTGIYHVPTQDEILNTMLEHARLLEQSVRTRYIAFPQKRFLQKKRKKKSNYNPFNEIRKILSWYIRGIPNAAHYRAQLVRVNTLEEVEIIIREIQASLPTPPS